MSPMQRREFLGVAGLATASAAAMRPSPAQAGDPSFLNNVPSPPLSGPELPTFKFALEKSPGKVDGGRYGKEATVRQLPISTGIAGVSMRLEPGVMRELHWHATAAEWQYVLNGQASVTLFGSGGRYRTETLQTGDVGYIPQGYGHSIENTGDGVCRVLIAFNSGIYQEIELSGWIAGNPPDVLATNFGQPAERFNAFPRRDAYITPGDKP